MPTIETEDLYELQIVAIGNAIVDILASVDDELLARNSLTKASMHLCSHAEQDKLLSEVYDFSTEAGGSAANTINSLSGLGIKAGFMGTIADDHWGLMFEESFKQNGVTSLVETITDSETITATSVILITQDSERTMNTHLGASGLISKSTLNFDAISQSEILYIEGYAFDKPEAKQAVLNAVAHSHSLNNKVALTLSDPDCVKRHHADFIELISNVDIVFANESEMARLWQCSESDITPAYVKSKETVCPTTTIITQSERGCTIMDNGEILSVPAKMPTELVDLTGAGDQFAAGYLYGFINGWMPQLCGQLAVDLATNVIAKVGPRIKRSELARILQDFEDN